MPDAWSLAPCCSAASKTLAAPDGSDKTPAPTMLFARFAVLAAVDKSTDGKLAAGEPLCRVCGGRTNVAFSEAIQLTA